MMFSGFQPSSDQYGAIFGVRIAIVWNLEKHGLETGILVGTY